MKLYDLRTEYRVNPIGIDRRHPRFSWKMESEQADTVQKSYRILVRTGEKTVWDHRKESDTSVLIPYAGTSLEPETTYHVTVEVTDNHENTAEETIDRKSVV